MTFHILIMNATTKVNCQTPACCEECKAFVKRMLRNMLSNICICRENGLFLNQFKKHKWSEQKKKPKSIQHLPAQNYQGTLRRSKGPRWVFSGVKSSHCTKQLLMRVD